VRLRAGDPPASTLALVAAVALHAVIGPLVPEVQIKWPNDLLARGAKLSGILLERSGETVVIGFGANLAHHPDKLERPVTSIAALAGFAPDPALVCSDLANRFGAWLARWRSEGLAPVRSAWLAAAHPPGTLLQTPEGEGRFDGLDPSGALRLRLPDGSLRSINAGDVFLV
jgi:BirA family transcriptional regulator, biotin operon repressor / biotin---[acetyl-CoA-carboxylase] ligase